MTTRRLPPAAIRTQIGVPLRLADGFTTTARVFTFDGLADGREHLALGLGDRSSPIRPGEDGAASPPLVRVHSECLTGDVLGSQRCDCGPQMLEAVRRLTAEGGYLLYLRQEGRGIGLYAKVDAYALQDVGLDTFEANVALGFEEDQRDYTVAAQMLGALGVERIQLLTNNPDKVAQLAELGVEVSQSVPTELHLSPSNVRYLAAKARHDHTIDLSAAELGGIDIGPADVSATVSQLSPKPMPAQPTVTSGTVRQFRKR